VQSCKPHLVNPCRLKKALQQQRAAVLGLFNATQASTVLQAAAAVNASLQDLSWPKGWLVQMLHGHLNVLLQHLRAVFEVLKLQMLMLAMMLLLLLV
jgi:hypothetical protein